MTEEIFTTTEIGRILGVNQSTVFRWVKSGKLKAHTTLGNHKRVKKSNLIRFFNENNMILPDDLKENQTESLKILIVEDDTSVLNLLAAGLTRIFHRGVPNLHLT